MKNGTYSNSNGSDIPNAENMSMDEILSSIRNIISQEDLEIHDNNIEKSIEQTNDFNLSSKEQLQALGGGLDVMERPRLQKKDYVSNKDYTDKQFPDYTRKDEILSTLNDIRQTLSEEYDNNDSNITDNLSNQVTNNKDQTIPSFLKKFKEEQNKKEIEAKNSKAEIGNFYNFVDIQKLKDTNEDSDVLELTDPITEFSSDKSNDDKSSTDALEDLMIKSIRPLLSDWLDNNLEIIAKKVIREELHKRKILS